MEYVRTAKNKTATKIAAILTPITVTIFSPFTVCFSI